MTIYSDLEARLYDNRYKPPKPIDKKRINVNTVLRRNGEDLTITYFQTNILTFRPNGTVTIDNGGWETISTKRRINSLIGSKVTIHSMYGKWWVQARQTERFAGTHWHENMEWNHAVYYQFTSGMSFDVDTGILVWNPHTWEPMEYIEGMISRPISHRLGLLEEHVRDCIDNPERLTNEMIDSALKRQEQLKEKFDALVKRMKSEESRVAWQFETTLQATMGALKQAAKNRRVPDPVFCDYAGCETVVNDTLFCGIHDIYSDRGLPGSVTV